MTPFLSGHLRRDGDVVMTNECDGASPLFSMPEATQIDAFTYELFAVVNHWGMAVGVATHLSTRNQAPCSKAIIHVLSS